MTSLHAVTGAVTAFRDASNLCSSTELNWSELGSALDDRCAHLERVLRRMRRTDADPSAPPRVAVCGDANAGKSTLLNCLLGPVWGGLPAGPFLGLTTTAIELAFANDGVTRVSRVGDAMFEPRERALLADASAEGDPRARLDEERNGRKWLREAIVAAAAVPGSIVRITCEAPVLRGATLVDTRGVNASGTRDADAIADVLSTVDICIAVTRSEVLTRTTREICARAARDLGGVPLVLVVNVSSSNGASADSFDIEATSSARSQALHRQLQDSLRSCGQLGAPVVMTDLMGEMLRIFGDPARVGALDRVSIEERERFDLLGCGQIVRALEVIRLSSQFSGSARSAAVFHIKSGLNLLQAVVDGRDRANREMDKIMAEIRSALNEVDVLAEELWTIVDDFIFETVLTGDDQSPFAHSLEVKAPNCVVAGWWDRFGPVKRAALETAKVHASALSRRINAISGDSPAVSISVERAFSKGPDVQNIVQNAASRAEENADRTFMRSLCSRYYADACNTYAKESIATALAKARARLDTAMARAQYATRSLPDSGGGHKFRDITASLEQYLNTMRGGDGDGPNANTESDASTAWVVDSFRESRAESLGPLLDAVTNAKATMVPSSPSHGGEGSAKSGHPLRILAMDGGGVRGTVLVAQLQRIEEEARQRALNEGVAEKDLPQIMDLFDFVCGTSAGGLVALGLAYGGVSLSHLKRVFQTKTKDIFPPGLHMMYDPAGLETVIKDLVGDCAMSSAEPSLSGRRFPFVFVTSTRMHNGSSNASGYLFRNYRNDASRFAGGCDSDVKLAARCTSAAPTYFPTMEIGESTFVDGGLGGNNPAAIALMEARARFPTREISTVVSLGTGNMPPPRKASVQQFLPRPLSEYLKAIMIAVQTSTSSGTTNAALLTMFSESKETRYFRLSPDFDEDISFTDSSRNAMMAMEKAVKEYFAKPYVARRVARIATSLMQNKGV